MHKIICGDSGAGKTVFIRQILKEIRRRGDLAVVLDSQLEFISQFYDPNADWILNPADQRCPYWALEHEVEDEVHGLGVSRAMYPEHPNNPTAKFWDDLSAKIADFLLTYTKPTCHEYSKMLANPDIIIAAVAGSEHHRTLTKDDRLATSVFATLSQFGYAMRMMPRFQENRRLFTIRSWCDNPTGWVFIGNTAVTRDALRPLQSAWIDIFILRLLSQKPRHNRRVWIVLDELDTLTTLPQLTTGIAQLRKTGNVLVLGMQNMSQLEDRYGRQAELIFSQAFTKLILRTSEARSARFLQDMVGDVEVRYIRQSRTTGLWGGRERDSYSGPEEQRKPLVMASEIQGLPPLTGYFLQPPIKNKVGLNVVRIKLPYEPPVNSQPSLIPRLIPPIELEDRKAAPAAEVRAQPKNKRPPRKTFSDPPAARHPAIEPSDNAASA